MITLIIQLILVIIGTIIGFILGSIIREKLDRKKNYIVDFPKSSFYIFNNEIKVKYDFYFDINEDIKKSIRDEFILNEGYYRYKGLEELNNLIQSKIETIDIEFIEDEIRAKLNKQVSIEEQFFIIECREKIK